MIRWDRSDPPTQEEAEARLRTEGYEAFCWNDVPGMSYPRHRHEYDECLWVLRGELMITIEPGGLLPENVPCEYRLLAGDRLYLPARTPHTARAEATTGVTYLVGSRRGD